MKCVGEKGTETAQLQLHMSYKAGGPRTWEESPDMQVSRDFFQFVA